MVTQRERVLDRLRKGPICTSDIYEDDWITHRLAARIHDLRSEGWIITTRPCQNTRHRHRSAAVEYVMESDGQQTAMEV